MKKYFYKTNFSYLCTPIDVVYFLLNFKGDEGECKLGIPSVASAAFGVKCRFTYYLRLPGF